MSGVELASIFLRIFREKLSTWTSCKNIFVVFLVSSYRETPKAVLKKKARKNVYLGLVSSSKVNQIYVGVRRFVLGVPLELEPAEEPTGTGEGRGALKKKQMSATDIGQIATIDK
jgi:hypothetical protein